jgi:transcriptional regulator with XRE-family HTH domain
MNTRDDLIEQLRDKEYRDAFVASQIDIGIPYQIRALRGKVGQKELAERAGMKQPRISNIERPGYANLNLTTLKRIAAAFDVALIVRFAPFSELIDWAESFSTDSFSVPAFDQDAKLFKGVAMTQTSSQVLPPTKTPRSTAAIAALAPSTSDKPVHSAVDAITLVESKPAQRRSALMLSIPQDPLRTAA